MIIKDKQISFFTNNNIFTHTSCEYEWNYKQRTRTDV